MASDDAYATVILSSNDSYYLKVSVFGFSLAAEATILGIEVFVERLSAVVNMGDTHAQLLQGGAVGGDNKAVGAIDPWPSTETTRTYGASNDLWGRTWTPAQINAADFGFVLAVNAAADIGSVDSIAITVHYEVPPTAPDDLAAAVNPAAPSTEILLEWDDNSSDETGFEVERSPNGSDWAALVTLAANTSSLADANLTPSTTYYYRVRAVGPGGNSDWSATANATTDALPATGGIGSANFNRLLVPGAR